ncbi:MAG: AI-2E family transporter [Bryobacterales bacterium]|nr:AI-2E family transporter [Bryobacterales bacterium]
MDTAIAEKRPAQTARGAVLLAAALVLVWLTADALLLLFGAVLLGILLRTISTGVVKVTGLPHGLALAMATLGLLSVFGLLGYLFIPRLAEQVRELRETLPAAWEKLNAQLAAYGWAKDLMEEAPPVDKVLSGTGKVFSRITGAVSGTVSAVASAILVLVLALFFAGDPQIYVNGFLRLVPMERRRRYQELAGRLHHALRHWLIGQLLAMAFIGVLTGSGLAIIGVPLTLALTLLAALLNFIPNLGPIIAAVPAVLLALTQSWQDALWVIGVYVVAQNIEGYLFTPMVQKKAVNIPPALTISSQLVFGLLFGFAGVALATPLAVATMVTVQTLYVEDTLGDFGQ